MCIRDRSEEYTTAIGSSPEPNEEIAHILHLMVRMPSAALDAVNMMQHGTFRGGPESLRGLFLASGHDGLLFDLEMNADQLTERVAGAFFPDDEVHGQGNTNTEHLRSILTALMLHSFVDDCLLYTSPSPRDATLSRMPSSA